MSRRYLIAGNWKMNKTASEGAQLIRDIMAQFADCKCKYTIKCPEILVCPPFTSIAAAVKAAKGTPVKVGAQNVHFEEKGAFTGEISGAMLVEAGVSYVIVGHSERRQYFAETNETVNKRLLAALKNGLNVIVCVGESLEERLSGVTSSLIEYQVRKALMGVAPEAMKKVVIAYEPVWAIGTGKTATDAEAQEVHAGIRALLAKLYGRKIANATRILYGGSMNDGNAAGLLAQPDIDGGLIGGAALKPAAFAAIIKAAKCQQMKA